MCEHQPRCPSAATSGRGTAAPAAPHPEQGWTLLCNGVIRFDDGGLLLPSGEAVAPPGRTPAVAPIPVRVAIVRPAHAA